MCVYLRYHPDVNGGCEKAAAKFRLATSAVHELRQLQGQSEFYSSSSMRSGNSRNNNSSSHKKYQYGAQYSTFPKPNRSRRNSTSNGKILSGNMRVGLGVSLAVLAGTAATVIYDTSQRETAYNNWVARDEARKLERASRPTIGKGRRAKHSGASPT